MSGGGIITFRREMLISFQNIDPCLVGGQDLVEDVVVGLEPLGGPVGAARIQRQKFEEPRRGHTAVGGPPQLQLDLNCALNLDQTGETSRLVILITFLLLFFGTKFSIWRCKI